MVPRDTPIQNLAGIKDLPVTHQVDDRHWNLRARATGLLSLVAAECSLGEVFDMGNSPVPGFMSPGFMGSGIWALVLRAA